MSPSKRRTKIQLAVAHVHSAKDILLGLFLTSMTIQMIAQSISPILPLYVRALGQRDNLIFVSGMIVSAMGVPSMLFSGWMGKLGDRIGNHRLY